MKIAVACDHGGLNLKNTMVAYLKKNKYKIIKRNYRNKMGEIDIIAKRGRIMVFVEVKCRKSLDIALDAVTRSQATRLRRAAETYIARNGWCGDARFDMIAVCGWRVHHIKNSI